MIHYIWDREGGSYLQTLSYMFPFINFSANLWFLTIASCKNKVIERFQSEVSVAIFLELKQTLRFQTLRASHLNWALKLVWRALPIPSKTTCKNHQKMNKDCLFWSFFQEKMFLCIYKISIFGSSCKLWADLSEVDTRTPASIFNNHQRCWSWIILWPISRIHHGIYKQASHFRRSPQNITVLQE